MLLLLGCTDYGLNKEEPPFDSAVGIDTSRDETATKDSDARDSGTIDETADPCDDPGALDPTVEVSSVEPDPDATDPVCSGLGDVSWDMQVEWSYAFTGFAMAPIAAPNQGRPGASVFVDADGHMLEVDGRDGSEVQRFRMLIPDGGNDDGSTPAVSDIDGDGDLDFAAPTALVVHLVDTGSATERVFDSSPSSGSAIDDDAIQFADVDLDGAAEVVLAASVFETDGTRLAATTNKSGTEVFVTDLDGDRLPEWVNATGIWSPRDGSGTAFDTSLSSDGYLYGAPIDISGPAIAGSLDQSTWATIRPDGTFTTMPVGRNQVSGLVAVGDVDGDGAAEVVRRDDDNDRVVVVDAAGNETLAWSFDTGDIAGGGTSLADLDADGVYEIVVTRISGLSILSGLTGEVLAELDDVGSRARDSAPLIADVDGDGSAEIVVTSTDANRIDGHLVAIGPESGRWARTRPVWNQLAYDAPTVHDDGTLAPFAAPGWSSLKAFRAQPGRDGDLPDLSVELDASATEVCDQPAILASLRVRSLGSKDVPAGAVVRLSSWDGATLTTLTEQTLPDAIPPGSQVRVTWTGPASGLMLLAEVVTEATECDPFDNQDEAGL